MKKVLLVAAVFLCAAACAFAFDYSHYYGYPEAEGAFYDNLDMGADLTAVLGSSTPVAVGFHMDWNMTFVPLPACLHIDMTTTAQDAGLLMTFGAGLDAMDLFGPNNTLGAGAIFAFESDFDGSWVGPYGRWVYRFTTKPVSDGVFFDLMIHVDLGYAFGQDGVQSFPVGRAGVCVGIITVTQDVY